MLAEKLIQWNGYGDSSFIVVSLQRDSSVPTGKQVLNKVYECWKATNFVEESACMTDRRGLFHLLSGEEA